MKRIVKLKQNGEFRRCYQRGKDLVCPLIVVYAFKNRTDNVRLGITAGKKIGNAVCRNRAKRLIAAAFRECLPMIKCGYDFVIVARTRILNVKSTQVAKQLFELLESADLIENEKDTD